MRLRIATWNVNSVRLRAEQAARFVDEQAPDVLCMQEIKCQEGEFPREAFEAMGLKHLKIAGQKGWHGVAIASRLPFFYIPAGGDTPDRIGNPKFDHKLDFYETLTAALKKRDPKAPLIVTGDLNIAPGENDVWSHRQMLKVVSHTPAELEAFDAMIKSMDLLDLPRLATPEPEKLFSWWSYRAADFRKSNRGLRLDHILASPGLRDAAIVDGKVSSRVHDTVREWERPSDHAPVTADLKI
jgi:exodeoxyribonuclease III